MNKNKFIEDDDVLEDLQYDLNVMLVQSISELQTSFFDTKSAQIRDYLNTYFEQGEFLIEMTEVYRNSLLQAYKTDTQ
jgi:hypothetical protein